MNENLNIAQKCTGCAHLLDSRLDASPAVWTPARPWPSGSWRRPRRRSSSQGAELLHPEEQKPRVYYLNVPKKFIAGTLYDPKAKEVVIGAALTLRSNGATWTTTTDGFGDFWFQNLDVGVYDLEIAAAGFAPKRYDAIDTKTT